MADDEAPPYRLGRTAAATSHIKDLLIRARRNGRFTPLVDALHEIEKQLKSDPVAFGDPWHRARHEGGRVFHRVMGHLSIRYVVFQREKVVVWLGLSSNDSFWDTPLK